MKTDTKGCRIPGGVNHFLFSEKKMTITNYDKCVAKKTGNEKQGDSPSLPVKLSWLNKYSPAFTLLELLVVIVIIGILASIAYIAYKDYVNKAQVVTAINEINMLEKEIYAYGLEGSIILPPDLDAIGYGSFLDPWNRPYVYQPDLTNPRTKAGIPINTDYDLYSRGRDGQSNLEITDAVSLDDIIRAGDGNYKGYAERY